jgi:peptidoglycan-N-acetylglucosamine deacetylase
LIDRRASSGFSGRLRAALGMLALLAAGMPVAAAEQLQQCPLVGQMTEAGLNERAIQKHVPQAHIAAPVIAVIRLPPVANELAGSIRSVKVTGGAKLVALTFDLCEAGDEITGYDAGVIDALHQFGVKATFFAGGKWLLTHPLRAHQLMADPLFEIGSHAWSHGNFRRLDVQQSRDEISKADAAYVATRESLAGDQCLRIDPAQLPKIGKQIGLFRFPYGACNQDALKLVAASGELAVQWDLALGDPASETTAEVMTDLVLRRIHPGAIIVGHANGRGVHTAAGLASMIPAVLAKGYRFVTVSELLAAGQPVVADSCYDHKAGDSDHYGEPKHAVQHATALKAAATVPVKLPKPAAPKAAVHSLAAPKLVTPKLLTP